MPERPNLPLGDFRRRVEESSELHKSTVGPRDEVRPDGHLRIHTNGFDPDERERIVAEEAARLRNAVQE
jgi:hypothetical protein